MAYPTKEKTVMTRIRITDHKFVKQLADSENLSISDKLSEIIRVWKASGKPTISKNIQAAVNSGGHDESNWV